MPFNAQGSVLSGTTYLRAKPRDKSGKRADWFALLIRVPTNCNCGGPDADDNPTVCLKCVESWSWDYDLAFWRTVGGRRFAEQLGLDPEEAGHVLRYRDGYEKASMSAKSVLSS